MGWNKNKTGNVYTLLYADDVILMVVEEQDIRAIISSPGSKMLVKDVVMT